MSDTPGFCLLDGQDIDVFPSPSPVPKLHDSVDLGEQSVVLPTSHIQSGEELGSTLADQYRPTADGLPAKPFDTEMLRIRIPTVTARSLSFFVRHCSPASVLFRGLFLLLDLTSAGASRLDAIDLHPQEILPMALRAAVALASLHLEDANLGTAHLVDEDCRDLGSSDQRIADLDTLVATHKQNPVELDLPHLFARNGNELDVDHVTGLDPVLLTTRLDYCVHGHVPPASPPRGADARA